MMSSFPPLMLQTVGYVVVDRRAYDDPGQDLETFLFAAFAGRDTIPIFPTYQEAVDFIAERGEFSGITPLAACRIKLPHCWMYDTQPLSSSAYALKHREVQIFRLRLEHKRLQSPWDDSQAQTLELQIGAVKAITGRGFVLVVSRGYEGEIYVGDKLSLPANQTCTITGVDSSTAMGAIGVCVEPDTSIARQILFEMSLEKRSLDGVSTR